MGSLQEAVGNSAEQKVEAAQVIIREMVDLPFGQRCQARGTLLLSARSTLAVCWLVS
ncbi:unnamed protein product [Arabis nemorensis]|uniref:Uncharacterized protein n=1 Tax=Arabis nemorensis TaxID=586526 RepID=A0A565CAV2_9BRAS|nr:unnamed protein product [Arabis nemorensis]